MKTIYYQLNSKKIVMDGQTDKHRAIAYINGKNWPVYNPV